MCVGLLGEDTEFTLGSDLEMFFFLSEVCSLQSITLCGKVVNKIISP